MAKVRICDHCGEVVTDLHKAYFREYYVGCEFDFGVCLPMPTSRVEKIDICKDCWSKLIKTEAKDDE